MSQLLTKFALYALTAVAIFDIARYRHHRRSAGTAKKALMTWEGEGGSHP
jgi:hypothetical protein